MWSRIRKALVVAVTVTSGVALITPDAHAAENYTLGTFNMYGHIGNKGNTEVADAVVRSVLDRKPLIVTLNEVCNNQAEHIDQKLSNYGIFFDPSLHETEWDPGHETGPLCGSGPDDGKEAQFGNAVLYNTDVIGDSPASYGYKLFDNRTMACIFGETMRVVACAVHLSTKKSERMGDDANPGEAERISLIARDELRNEFPDAPTFDGHTRIIGGDFNAQPNDPEEDTMDWMYHHDYGEDAKGDFKEVDSSCENTIKSDCRDGETTADDLGPFEDGIPGTRKRKIDYIFVDPGVQIRSADVTFSKYSDHDPLWADVTF